MEKKEERGIVTPPPQKPGRSKQDYGTPFVLLRAVHARLAITAFACDLAATAANTVAVAYYDLAANALAQSWGWSWCNPPFARLPPWVQRADAQARRGAHVAMLVPAAVGANWWRDSVHGKCSVLFLNPRIKFVGEKSAYPKDCCLLLYGPDVAPGYDVWRWTRDGKYRPLLQLLEGGPHPGADVTRAEVSPLEWSSRPGGHP